MNTVADVLDMKGRDVWSIEATQSAYDAVEMMVQKNVGALIVSSQESQLAGIVSERDCARKVMLLNKPATDIQVADIMTRDVVVAREDTSTDICMSLMSGHKIRHLPVMKGGTPIGIITVGDLMKFIIKAQAMTIEELESFVFVETGGEG
ncbi:MAG: CBS domain-containing protein [Pseudomonadales bacterium]|nr:CBS domain-containing protein [Pseudomonadales bacterium]